MTRSVTFGIYPAPMVAPYAELAARARAADELGFETLWVADQTPMANPSEIHFEAWSMLAALARETKRIRLGTLVTPAVLRHPVLNAMAVSTLDHASGGRAVIGFGAGGVAADLDAVGEAALTPRDLIARLDEQVTVVDALLRGETVTREDGAYRTRKAWVERPVQTPRPPIVIAAQGPRSVALAARHADVWNSLGGQPMTGDRVPAEVALAETRRQVEMLDEACSAAGRNPAAIGRSVFAFRSAAGESGAAFEDWVGRHRDLGFDEFITWWPEGGTAVVEQLAEVGQRLRSSG